ncbi:MAG: hypothetical protein LBP26_07015 [Clostridiales bacterium]|nr:hypothetical protein [Clostridiales bacterium]
MATEKIIEFESVNKTKRLAFYILIGAFAALSIVFLMLWIFKPQGSSAGVKRIALSSDVMLEQIVDAEGNTQDVYAASINNEYKVTALVETIGDIEAVVDWEVFPAAAVEKLADKSGRDPDDRTKHYLVFRVTTSNRDGDKITVRAKSGAAQDVIAEFNFIAREHHAAGGEVKAVFGGEKPYAVTKKPGEDNAYAVKLPFLAETTGVYGTDNSYKVYTEQLAAEGLNGVRALLTRKVQGTADGRFVDSVKYEVTAGADVLELPTDPKAASTTKYEADANNVWTFHPDEPASPGKILDYIPFTVFKTGTATLKITLNAYNGDASNDIDVNLYVTVADVTTDPEYANALTHIGFKLPEYNFYLQQGAVSMKSQIIDLPTAPEGKPWRYTLYESDQYGNAKGADYRLLNIDNANENKYVRLQWKTGETYLTVQDVTSGGIGIRSKAVKVRINALVGSLKAAVGIEDGREVTSDADDDANELVDPGDAYKLNFSVFNGNKIYVKFDYVLTFFNAAAKPSDYDSRIFFTYANALREPIPESDTDRNKFASFTDAQRAKTVFFNGMSYTGATDANGRRIYVIQNVVLPESSPKDAQGNISASFRLIGDIGAGVPTGATDISFSTAAQDATDQLTANRPTGAGVKPIKPDYGVRFAVQDTAATIAYKPAPNGVPGASSDRFVQYGGKYYLIRPVNAGVSAYKLFDLFDFKNGAGETVPVASKPHNLTVNGNDCFNSTGDYKFVARTSESDPVEITLTLTPDGDAAPITRKIYLMYRYAPNSIAIDKPTDKTFLYTGLSATNTLIHSLENLDKDDPSAQFVNAPADAPKPFVYIFYGDGMSGNDVMLDRIENLGTYYHYLPTEASKIPANALFSADASGNVTLLRDLFALSRGEGAVRRDNFRLGYSLYPLKNGAGGIEVIEHADNYGNELTTDDAAKNLYVGKTYAQIKSSQHIKFVSYKATRNFNGVALYKSGDYGAAANNEVAKGTEGDADGKYLLTVNTGVTFDLYPAGIITYYDGANTQTVYSPKVNAADFNIAALAEFTGVNYNFTKGAGYSFTATGGVGSAFDMTFAQSGFEFILRVKVQNDQLPVTALSMYYDLVEAQKHADAGTPLSASGLNMYIINNAADANLHEFTVYVLAKYEGNNGFYAKYAGITVMIGTTLYSANGTIDAGKFNLTIADNPTGTPAGTDISADDKNTPTLYKIITLTFTRNSSYANGAADVQIYSRADDATALKPSFKVNVLTENTSAKFTDADGADVAGTPAAIELTMTPNANNTALTAASKVVTVKYGAGEDYNPDTANVTVKSITYDNTKLAVTDGVKGDDGLFRFAISTINKTVTDESVTITFTQTLYTRSSATTAWTQTTKDITVTLKVTVYAQIYKIEFVDSPGTDTLSQADILTTGGSGTAEKAFGIKINDGDTALQPKDSDVAAIKYYLTQTGGAYLTNANFGNIGAFAAAENRAELNVDSGKKIVMHNNAAKYGGNAVSLYAAATVGEKTIAVEIPLNVTTLNSVMRFKNYNGAAFADDGDGNVTINYFGVGPMNFAAEIQNKWSGGAWVEESGFASQYSIAYDFGAKNSELITNSGSTVTFGGNVETKAFTFKATLTITLGANTHTVEIVAAVNLANRVAKIAVADGKTLPGRNGGFNVADGFELHLVKGYVFDTDGFFTLTNIGDQTPWSTGYTLEILDKDSTAITADFGAATNGMSKSDAEKYIGIDAATQKVITVTEIATDSADAGKFVYIKLTAAVNLAEPDYNQKYVIIRVMPVDPAQTVSGVTPGTPDANGVYSLDALSTAAASNTLKGTFTYTNAPHSPDGITSVDVTDKNDNTVTSGESGKFVYSLNGGVLSVAPNLTAATALTNADFDDTAIFTVTCTVTIDGIEFSSSVKFRLTLPSATIAADMAVKLYRNDDAVSADAGTSTFTIDVGQGMDGYAVNFSNNIESANRVLSLLKTFKDVKNDNIAVAAKAYTLIDTDDGVTAIDADTGALTLAGTPDSSVTVTLSFTFFGKTFTSFTEFSIINTSELTLSYITAAEGEYYGDEGFGGTEHTVSDPDDEQEIAIDFGGAKARTVVYLAVSYAATNYTFANNLTDEQIKAIFTPYTVSGTVLTPYIKDGKHHIGLDTANKLFYAGYVASNPAILDGTSLTPDVGGATLTGQVKYANGHVSVAPSLTFKFTATAPEFSPFKKNANTDDAQELTLKPSKKDGDPNTLTYWSGINTANFLGGYTVTYELLNGNIENDIYDDTNNILKLQFDSAAQTVTATAKAYVNADGTVNTYSLNSASVRAVIAITSGVYAGYTFTSQAVTIKVDQIAAPTFTANQNVIREQDDNVKLATSIGAYYRIYKGDYFDVTFAGDSIVKDPNLDPANPSHAENGIIAASATMGDDTIIANKDALEAASGELDSGKPGLVTVNLTVQIIGTQTVYEGAKFSVTLYVRINPKLTLAPVAAPATLGAPANFTLKFRKTAHIDKDAFDVSFTLTKNNGGKVKANGGGLANGASMPITVTSTESTEDGYDIYTYSGSYYPQAGEYGAYTVTAKLSVNAGGFQGNFAESTSFNIYSAKFDNDGSDSDDNYVSGNVIYITPGQTLDLSALGVTRYSPGELDGKNGTTVTFALNSAILNGEKLALAGNDLRVIDGANFTGSDITVTGALRLTVAITDGNVCVNDVDVVIKSQPAPAPTATLTYARFDGSVDFVTAGDTDKNMFVGETLAVAVTLQDGVTYPISSLSAEGFGADVGSFTFERYDGVSRTAYGTFTAVGQGSVSITLKAVVYGVTYTVGTYTFTVKPLAISPLALTPAVKQLAAGGVTQVNFSGYSLASPSKLQIVIDALDANAYIGSIKLYAVSDTSNHLAASELTDGRQILTYTNTSFSGSLNDLYFTVTAKSSFDLSGAVTLKTVVTVMGDDLYEKFERPAPLDMLKVTAADFAVATQNPAPHNGYFFNGESATLAVGLKPSLGGKVGGIAVTESIAASAYTVFNSDSVTYTIADGNNLSVSAWTNNPVTSTAYIGATITAFGTTFTIAAGEQSPLQVKFARALALDRAYDNNGGWTLSVTGLPGGVTPTYAVTYYTPADKGTVAAVAGESNKFKFTRSAYWGGAISVRFTAYLTPGSDQSPYHGYSLSADFADDIPWPAAPTLSAAVVWNSSDINGKFALAAAFDPNFNVTDPKGTVLFEFVGGDKNIIDLPDDIATATTLSQINSSLTAFTRDFTPSGGTQRIKITFTFKGNDNGIYADGLTMTAYCDVTIYPDLPYLTATVVNPTESDAGTITVAFAGDYSVDNLSFDVTNIETIGAAPAVNGFKDKTTSGDGVTYKFTVEPVKATVYQAVKITATFSNDDFENMQFETIVYIKVEHDPALIPVLSFPSDKITSEGKVWTVQPLITQGTGNTTRNYFINSVAVIAGSQYIDGYNNADKGIRFTDGNTKFNFTAKKVAEAVSVVLFIEVRVADAGAFQYDGYVMTANVTVTLSPETAPTLTVSTNHDNQQIACALSDGYTASSVVASDTSTYTSPNASRLALTPIVAASSYVGYKYTSFKGPDNNAAATIEIIVTVKEAPFAGLKLIKKASVVVPTVTLVYKIRKYTDTYVGISINSSHTHSSLLPNDKISLGLKQMKSSTSGNTYDLKSATFGGEYPWYYDIAGGSNVRVYSNVTITSDKFVGGRLTYADPGTGYFVSNNLNSNGEYFYNGGSGSTIQPTIYTTSAAP